MPRHRQSGTTRRSTRRWRAAPRSALRYFGTLWTYLALPCAFWPAEDADRYTGPWDAETSATILLISRLYDPATPHGGAVAASETLANARLLTIDGWGHGFFDAGRSTCADDSMAAYLIDLELPPVDTICPEDVPPFSEPAPDEAGAAPQAETPGALAAPSSLPVSAIPAVAQSATPAAASPVPASGDFAGLVDIGGGRRMYLECRGSGGPTVVLEAGYGNAGAIWDQAALGADSDKTAVLPGVEAFTRVCAYDRPGAQVPPSRSDPVPQPRTIAAVVADLHALLVAAGEPGPYVLVGHSLGGLMVRLYAAAYPDEVAGLVLVDPSVEGQEARFRAALTPEQADALAALQNAAAAGDPAFERYGPAGVGVAEAGEEVRGAVAASPFAGKPMVLITHGVSMGSDIPPGLLPPGFPWDALEQALSELHRELVAATPGARLVVAAESGHYVQFDEPELVIDAVWQVVEAVRDPSTWATPVTGTPTP